MIVSTYAIVFALWCSCIFDNLSPVNGQITTQRREQPSSLELLNIQNCCQFTEDSQSLFKCVNDSSTMFASQVLSVQANPKIAIVSFATSKIVNYAAYAFAVNEAYAEANKYMFKLVDPDENNFEPSDVRWNKVKVLEKALETWAKDCSYIVWIDADFIFLDMGMKFEEIVHIHPEAEVWVSASEESSTDADVMNSGCMVLKNSEFVRKWLLPMWWTIVDRKVFNDQSGFNRLYMEYIETKGLREKVVILPSDALNSNPPSSVKLRDHNQVLHLMGDSTELRVRVFKTAFLEICACVSSAAEDSEAYREVSVGQSVDATLSEVDRIVRSEEWLRWSGPRAAQDSSNRRSFLIGDDDEAFDEDEEDIEEVSNDTCGADDCSEEDEDEDEIDGVYEDEEDDVSEDERYRRFIDKQQQESAKHHQNQASISTKKAGQGTLKLFNSSTLRRQLGIDQQVLLAVNLITYKTDVEKRMRSYNQKLGEDSFNSIDATITLGANMRRYTDALDHVKEVWSPDQFDALTRGDPTPLDQHLISTHSQLLTVLAAEGYTPMTRNKIPSYLGAHSQSSDEIRERVFALFYQNLKSVERISQLKHTHANELTDFGMLIYNVAELGAMVIKRRTIKRLAVAAENPQAVNLTEYQESVALMESLLQYADQMMSYFDPSERGICYHLRSQLYIEHAMMEQHNPDISIRRLKRALKEKEKEAALVGEQCMPRLLSLLAERLCQVQRYEEAFPYIDRSIRILEKHSVSTFVGIASQLFISGQARGASGRLDEAIPLLERSIQIYEKNPQHEKEYTFELPKARQIVAMIKNQLRSSDQGKSNGRSRTGPATSTSRKTTKSSKSKGK